MLARTGWAWNAPPGPTPGQPEAATAAAPGAPMPGLGAHPLPPASAEPVAPEPVRLPGPLVYLRADNPLTMLQVQSAGDSWLDVCHVPCGRLVDPAQVYRVTGRRFVPTDPFSLPRSSGQVTIDARMGLKVRNIVGRVLIPVGGAVILTGVLLFLEGSRQSQLASDSVGANSDSQRDHLYGAVAVVGGIAVTVAGLLLWRGNVSSVDVE
jgi:hypothetical protein